MPRLSKIGAACLAAFGYTQGTSTITANLLVVGGGGGGGTGAGGGGGAGGVLTNITNLNYSLTYVVTVGAGGTVSTNGASSSFDAFSTASGGGYGASYNVRAAANGASGGGGTLNANTAGTGISGQGNAGGAGNNGNSGNTYYGGGGGGAGAVGQAGGAGSAGGIGVQSSITGTATYYGGGGGGQYYVTNTIFYGAGGSGGGGSNSNGTANLGGGGGGNTTGGTLGGSGVVIISYTSPTQLFGGGVVTFVGGNWIHTFTTSGTLVPASTFTANFLVIAGGGGGANPFINTNSGGGGGGAGGYRTSAGTSGGGGAAETALTLDLNSNYVVTVGSGGAGNTGFDQGGSGSNSSLLTITSLGGGGGGRQSRSGNSGGSGGGDCGVPASGGNAGTANQGYSGGSGVNGLVQSGAGGGGAGAVGNNTAGTGAGGAGGAGVASTITGTSVTRAGGGGGGGSGAGGAGGTGGGGAGGSGGVGVAGTANTGGGAGGNYGNATGQNGGSGVVIISYAGAQRMAGGTVTFVGGNTIHTFTSSGYLSALKLVNNSLRFKSSTSSYLSRTFGTPTNNKVWTWSAWVKRGKASGTSAAALHLFGTGSGSTDAGTTQIYFDNENLVLGGYSTVWLKSNAVYRDFAAWYHIVVAWDNSNATATNRAKIYVNGVEITYVTDNRASLSTTSTYGINQAVLHTIGAWSWNNGTFAQPEYFDGYMTEINFVDGQALTPSSFGGYNSFGVWQPTEYLGSYGTNGFDLPFTNNASSTTIGYDFSPNQNNFTSTGFTLTPTTSDNYDSMTDVPTLTSSTASNYAVLNPLDTVGGTFSNANLSVSLAAGGGNLAFNSIGMTTGKFYWEVIPTTGAAPMIGVADANTSISTRTFNGANGWYYYNTGQKYNNGTASAYGATYTANDVIGVALDMDAGTLTFYKNGATQGVAYSGFTGKTMIAALNNGGSGAAQPYNVNFGQRPFAQTIPTGFVRLNTFNM